MKINSKTENYLVFTLLTVISLLYLSTAYFSEGLGYGGDSFSHYLISRYSWKHTELFLHNWGKPFFILTSSLFSQFGWSGMIVFNITCALLTAYLTYLYCKSINLPHSWMSILLVTFAPIYFSQIPTGHTEPLFSFIVILSAYLLLRKNYLSGSILISFLPFVRTEGFGMLPLFFLLLILRRKFSIITFLFTGLIVYSIVGYFIKGDILWVFNENYGYESITYGMKGSLFHYLIASPFMYGPPLLFLMIVGLIYLLIIFIQNRKNVLKEEGLLETLVIMTGYFVMLFSAYSIIWWKGILDVIGDLRYLAGTIPGAVVTAMFGMKLITEKLCKVRLIYTVFFVILSASLFLATYRVVGFPVNLNREQSMTKEASLWLKSLDYADSKIYYFNPIVPVVLNIDPYDKNRMAHLWDLKRESPPKNSIIFWDAHFGPNEARLPLETLMKNPNMQLLKSFIPERPFKTLKGYKFEIHIFITTN